MTENKKPRLFISYRRSGGGETARRIHDQLLARGYDVFLDLESLHGGSFDEALLDQIASRDVLLVVLNKGSLNRRYGGEDWLRREVAHAFRCGLKVIPLLHEDFSFPSYLPTDISPLDVQGGLKINLEFIDPWLDKLEKYILSAPQKPVVYHFKEPRGQWIKYLVAALGAVLIGGCLFFGISNFTGTQPATPTTEPTVAPTEAPTVAPTEAPTAAPTAAPTNPVLPTVQQLGNSTGNQCNDGLCETTTWYLTGNNVHYDNRVGDWLYWYNSSNQNLMARHTDDKETKAIATIADLGYLLVTDSGFYYTVEKGNVATLYRADRLAMDQMGEPEVMASGFSANNCVMIDGEGAYYWYTGRGLYRLDLADGTETRVLDMETTWSVDAFGISGDWIYLKNSTQIQRVKMATGELQTLLDTTERFEDTTLAACNVDSAWVYFAVTDSGKTGFAHYDRIYRMHIDGSGVERIYVAEGGDCRISYLGLQSDLASYDHGVGFEAKTLVIGYRCATKRDLISVTTGKYTIHDHVHEEPFAQTLGVHAGNCQTNLCNGGFVTYMPEQGRYAHGESADELYLNRFDANEGTTYRYDQTDRTVKLKWTENGETQTKVLLEKVTCHYLFVTPDWFYCVLEENGTNTLYRAENLPEDHSIGALEKVVSGFLMVNNNLQIHNGYVYYWMDDDGLYRNRLDGSAPTRMWDQGGKGWEMFYVDDTHVYFWLIKGGFYRASLESNGHEHLCDYAEDPGRITGAVEKDGKFYYTVRYLTDGLLAAPDEVWSINPDGTEKTLVCALSDISMKATGINRTGSLLTLQVEQDGQTYLYRVAPDSGELTMVKTYE